MFGGRLRTAASLPKDPPIGGLNPFGANGIQRRKDNMLSPVVGLHHVTAIASNPQTNLDFYTDVLGLRFVKRTVNFDDPGTYHFYFGDDIGSPGTILTFFAWPHAPRGRVGTGETSAVAFSVPASSLHFWERRILAAGSP